MGAARFLRTMFLGPPVIGVGMLVVALALADSSPAPASEPSIHGMRCRWQGRDLIARGTLVDFADRPAIISVEPDVSLAGVGRLAHGPEAVDLPATAGRDWRWTNGDTGVPAGTAITRCSAIASLDGGGEDD